jgi:nucleoside-diphosphate-sugar epimerase
MRVVVTGGAGFIGRAIVKHLVDRGDEVVALVRDPAKASHLPSERVTLVQSDLSDQEALCRSMAGADAVIHAAGSYRIGIKKSERDAMWDANVGATQRVLDAAVSAGVPRIVYVSTANVFGDTHGKVVDETYRRDEGEGFISFYDESKFRAHEAALARIANGAPVVIIQPAQVYGPNDHSGATEQIDGAYHGRLRYKVFPTMGFGWVHVDDVAAGILAALDKGRVGESYVLAGEPRRMAESLVVAARAGGRKPPRLTLPTRLLRLIAPLSDRVGGLPGLPPNLRETISAGGSVTYWASHEKATKELGFEPRSLEQGVVDTWGPS